MAIERFLSGHLSDLDALDRLYGECKKRLAADGILQWGEWGNGYPDRSFLEEALSRGELFLLTDASGVLGAVVLNEKQSEEWKGVPWRETARKALVIHALVVNPKRQGRGWGGKLLDYCERRAREAGCGSLRLDAFPKNESATRLYLGYGFEKRGSVRFEGKPENNQEYYCYEKIF